MLFTIAFAHRLSQYSTKNDCPWPVEFVYQCMAYAVNRFLKLLRIKTYRKASAPHIRSIRNGWMSLIYAARGLSSRSLLSLVVLAGLMGTSGIQAQAYEGQACETGNSSLKTLLQKGSLDGVPLHFGITGDADRWATSFLKAEGKPPERMPDYDVELDGDMDIHDWTCMFAAFRAFDKNEDTAWAEGVEGPGIGEVLIVKLEDSRQSIRIRPGFAMTDALFKANNRPRKIRVYAISPHKGDVTQMGLLYSDWKVLTQKEFELKDSNSWQSIQLPGHKPSDTYGSFIAIEIVSVYKGSKYDDTLITEVMN